MSIVYVACLVVWILWIRKRKERYYEQYRGNSMEYPNRYTVSNRYELVLMEGMEKDKRE